MTPRLITIPISHYCEKARWALDRAGIAHREEPHVQFVHIAAALRAGGGRTVPVLVPGDGPVLRQSWEILRWADARTPADRRLHPTGAEGVRAAELEARFDAGLGPDGRLWMYHGTLPVVRDMAPWALAGTPRSERRAFAVAGGALDPLIRRYLGVDDARAAAALVALRDLGKSTQVVLLTCHRRWLDLAASAAPDARILELPPEPSPIFTLHGPGRAAEA